MKVYICNHCGAESIDEADENKDCIVCENGFMEEHEIELSKSERDEIADDMRGDAEYDEEMGK